MNNITVQVDRDADAAYIQLFDGAVVRSVAVGDDVVVDLDEMNVVVGVEMLHLNAEIPYSELVSQYHVHSDVTELLRRLRPSISGFLGMHSMGEGSYSGSRVAV